MEMIAIFCALSMLIGILALKKPSVFLVVILAVFFPYYFLIGLLNVKLDEGGAKYIFASFLLALLIYLFFRKMLICRTKALFTINSLDVLYISYYSLWFIVFLINLNHSLFVYKPYVQALFWLTITFILPIILKPIYSQTTISDFVRYLEWLGYFAALAVFICLLLGITSKETLAGYEVVDLSKAFRYAPFRGFFSTRQAMLLSISVIIFVSKVITDELSKKRIAIRVPFIILCFLGIVISGSRGTFIFLCLLCFYLAVSVKRFSKKRIISVVIALYSTNLL